MDTPGTGPADQSGVGDVAQNSASFEDVQSKVMGPRFGKWRHVMGLSFLTVTIFLWTASNFMASTIFADNTYSKPYFVTYFNTSFFILPILPTLVNVACSRLNVAKKSRNNWRSAFTNRYSPLRQDDEDLATGADANSSRSGPLRSSSQESLLGEPQDQSHIFNARSVHFSNSHFTLSETAKLSMEFCVLWFVANYFASACLRYTTVASATILNSTSSVFTLIIGSVFRAERFSLLKVVGVAASLSGIILITLVDLSGQTSDDEHRGDFPEKSPGEIIVGDLMALTAAVIYGAYAVLMKKRIEDESRINMQLFFGFVGLFDVLLLWPGFLILHFTGVEKAELPPTTWVTTIIVSNAVASLISDITWAYAVLFTSPLVVTVGLSITIPLSLIGQIILNNQTVGLWYWVGAAVVVLSFTLVSHEGKKDEVGSLTPEARTDIAIG